MRVNTTVVRRGGVQRAAQGEQNRLLVTDDHALILEGLAATIGRQEDMAVVATARTGREAVALWRAHRPDVSLLDLRMPEMNGVAAIQEIRAADSAARIVVHTTYDT